jgi:predicted glycosyltransferase
MRRNRDSCESAGDEFAAAVDRASVAPLPRVLFYSHDGFGLGHIQRTLAIAASLARHRPQVAMLALTTAIQGDSHRLPLTFDYVRIPSNEAQNARQPRSLRLANSELSKRILATRESVITATADAYRPQMMVVDEMPAGRHRELVPALSLLRRAAPRVEIVLTLKEIIDTPASLRPYWRNSGGYQLAEETYDRILVFGDRRIGDPVADLDLPPSVAAKTTFCGYIYDPTDTGEAEVIRARLGLAGTERPLIVVTVGGGADGAPVVRAYLEALRERLLPPVASFVTTGPLLDGERRDELDRLAAGLPDLTIVPYAPDLRAYLEAADLVVSMGGYNTISEVVGLGKRALVVPRERWREQVIRAERLAPYGVISVLRLRDLSPESLARAIASMLGSSPPPHDLDFGGFERAGAILSAALDR